MIVHIWAFGGRQQAARGPVRSGRDLADVDLGRGVDLDHRAEPKAARWLTPWLFVAARSIKMAEVTMLGAGPVPALGHAGAAGGAGAGGPDTAGPRPGTAPFRPGVAGCASGFGSPGHGWAGSICQFFPFHSSASVARPVPPTAMQRRGVAHEIPFSWPLPGGTGSDRSVRPSHRSAAG